ncbi:glycosyltransferase family 4 protein [Nonomuraea jiangxiensis]|uniref:Glycosyltransferase involved in cell wall bisynthesis n=1 Tax=Nonomuraea jiangxiensis TaxID=633440 RepID=A0A1G9RGS0_9ACTN|nr:glycosyltransferase family 4 protein [Nonomuraea jiangxiensis]SDM22371.1 Glycosyltransferase involved in cell wall bisynthesis [Nonomuraea jiangxiensis]
MRIRYLMLDAYGGGGTVRTVVSQANAMAAAGHRVELVSLVRRRETPQFAPDPRVTVTTLVDQRGGRQPDSAGRRAWRRIRGNVVPRGEFAAGHFTERVERAALDYVSGLRDGILVTTRPALNLISARRTPGSVVRVAQEHMNLTAYPESIRNEIARHYGRLDAITVLTRTNRLEYQRLLPGTPIVQLPNAVHRVERERSQQVNPVVVAAGRLVPQKGFDLLIQAFAQVVPEHPDWRLRIFGTGPRGTELAGLVEQYGLGGHVTLPGRTERLDKELADASVYALSSRFEGLPMVMIEAMTHALPVVAFDCPTGPGDVLTDGVDGVLVPPRDVDALAATLKRVIADRDLRLSLGTAAAKTALSYGADQVMPRWEKLFEMLSRGERVIDGF